MKISDMIELAQAGVKAKDVLTLHKAGYTKEMIVELSEEQPKDPEEPNEDPKPEEEDPAPDKDTVIDKEDKQEQKDPIKEELERVKKELADLQEKNRHKDISGPEPEDKLKHIKEFIASKM